MEDFMEQGKEPTGELRRLRDRSDKEELTGELKRSLLGGVNRNDVMAYVDKLKAHWLVAEQTYKTYIADLSREKETLRQERDALETRVTEQMALVERSQETSDPLSHPQVLELYEQARQAQEGLSTAQRRADEAQARCDELEEQLKGVLEDSRSHEIRLRALIDEREAGSRDAVLFEQRCAQYESTIVELNARLNDQLYELSDASARVEELSREAEQSEAALRKQAQAQVLELQKALEAARTQQQNAQSKTAQLEQQVSEAALAVEKAERRLAEAQSEAEAARAQLHDLAATNQALREQAQAQALKLQDAQEAVRAQQQNTQSGTAQLEQQAYEAALAAERAERRLADAQSEAESARAQLREQAVANQTLREQVRAEARGRILEEERARKLEAENRSLSAQLEDVSTAIEDHMQKIDDARALNARLKESLSNLLVKAEALIRENEMLSGQLYTERERVGQYQSVHERLVDMLNRMRMAHQLLNERMSDVDRTLSYGAPRSMGMPPPAAGSRRLNMEPLDLDGGGSSSAIYDMIQELNTLQSSLTQLQTAPVAEEDKKSNIRYRMEKLEVDCPKKKDGEPDAFRVTGDYAPKPRQNRE